MDFITSYVSRGSTSLSGQFFNKLLTIHRTKHNVVFVFSGCIGQLTTRFLKLDHLSLTFFVTSQLEMLRTLDGNLLTAFALGAFKTKYQFLGGLCLLPQDGFGLTSETLLFAIVTPTSLCKLRFL